MSNKSLPAITATSTSNDGGVNQTDINITDLNSTINLRFGSYNDNIGNPGNYFDGIIDNVRIYNRLLTSEEITLIYNNYL